MLAKSESEPRFREVLSLATQGKKKHFYLVN